MEKSRLCCSSHSRLQFPLPYYAPSGGTTVCDTPPIVSWSPAHGVGVFVFVQACGTFSSGDTGFTSSFHNATAWANSTLVQAQGTDGYIQAFPCVKPVTVCGPSYTKDLSKLVKFGTFPSVTKSFGSFSGSKELQCIITFVQSFNVTYMGTNHNFVGIGAEQDFTLCQ